LFDPAAADVASVLLITIVWTIVSVLFYALLCEGNARLLVLGSFALFAATEIHHVVESILKSAYDPGVITSVPYAVLGYLLLVAVAREFKSRQALVVAHGSVA
jgi:hypothetical protein